MIYKGHHYILDASEAYGLDANWVLESMNEVATKVGTTVVFKTSVKLPVTDGLSPPGFTSVCLLDESHLTAHYYEDKGLLAIDAFTCGSIDKAADIIYRLKNILSTACVGIKFYEGKLQRRFPHVDPKC